MLFFYNFQYFCIIDSTSIKASVPVLPDSKELGRIILFPFRGSNPYNDFHDAFRSAT
jgi:hypothetical protein